MRRLLICAIILFPLAVNAEPSDSEDACKEHAKIEEIAAKYPKASNSCAEAIKKVDRCCQNPELADCQNDDDKVNDQRSEAPQPAAQAEAESKEFGVHKDSLKGARESLKVSAKYRKYSRVCGRHIVPTEAECGLNKEDLEVQVQTLQLGNEVLERRGKRLECYREQRSASDAHAEGFIAAANASSGNSEYAISCKNDDCSVRRKDQGSELVSGEDIDKLPVKPVPVEIGNAQCSGYPTTGGTVVTAGHCVEGARTAFVLEPSDQDNPMYKIKGTPYGPNDADKDFGSMAPAQKSKKVTGKPFYQLAHDPRLSSGCKVSGSILACSSSALKGMQGNQATIAGYPGSHFGTDNTPEHAQGPVNSRYESVLVSRGPAYYTEAPIRISETSSNSKKVYSAGTTRQFQVIGYASPGSSGGPVSIPAGTYGGVRVDRPVVIGPVATVSNGNGRVITNVPVQNIDTVRRYVPQSLTNEQMVKSRPLFSNPK